MTYIKKIFGVFNSFVKYKGVLRPKYLRATLNLIPTFIPAYTPNSCVCMDHYALIKVRYNQCSEDLQRAPSAGLSSGAI